MYKPFNKSIKEVSKSNAWEKAVYRYATCPLNEEIPAPKTRIEQLAKAFVFDEKIASNIQKLKEINRCIAACEAYDNYEKEKDSLQNICMPQIKVTFGTRSNKSKDEHTSDNFPKIVSAKNDSLQIDTTQSVPESEKTKERDISNENQSLSDKTGYVQEEVKLTQNPNKDRDSRERLPVLTELSSLKDVCKVLHKLTLDEDFNKVPNTSQQLIFLMNKLSGENGNKIWSALQDDEVPTFKRALVYLHNHLTTLQEKECEKKTKEELHKLVTSNRV